MPSHPLNEVLDSLAKESLHHDAQQEIFPTCGHQTTQHHLDILHLVYIVHGIAHLWSIYFNILHLDLHLEMYPSGRSLVSSPRAKLETKGNEAFHLFRSTSTSSDYHYCYKVIAIMS